MDSLSDVELDRTLVSLCGSERSVTLQVLEQLNELEKRGAFRALGYSSLFDYATRRLSYSDSSAHRRVCAARCIRELPELRESFLEGKVNLCSISAAASSLRNKQTAVSDIVGKSRREVELLVAKENPVIRVKEVIKPIAVATPPVLAAVSTPVEERYSLKFSLSKDSYQQFEEVKNRLSNSLGRDLSMEAVVTKLMELYLKPARTKETTVSSTKRYIPRGIKEAVIKRDNGQCTFCSPSGTRCSAKRHLQIDHIEPFAFGGRTELSNLRLLCPAHNRLQAERSIGVEKMRTFTGGSKYENARV